jgi:hypothetical protein
VEEEDEAWGIIDGLVPQDEVSMQAFFWLTMSERGAEGEKEWTTPLLAMANAATMEVFVNIIANHQCKNN